MSISETTGSSSAIETYFKNQETLSELEKWDEMIVQGIEALEIAKEANRVQDIAKICSQLTSTAFFLGDYEQALAHINHCRELTEEFLEPAQFIEVLYLESAIYRTLAAKAEGETAQQASYHRAVEIGEEAAQIYLKNEIENKTLQGKIYFNLGAAHADNFKGDLEKAVNYYLMALDCFKTSNNDIVSTNIRLGKVYLLQQKPDLTQKIIDEIRPLISNQRLAMHADYLEAQLKLDLNDLENAVIVAKMGLVQAKL